MEKRERERFLKRKQKYVNITVTGVSMSDREFFFVRSISDTHRNYLTFFF